MGMFDSVNVPCPQCGELNEFQSKSGPCALDVYTIDNCPADVMLDINRHSPSTCFKCGTQFHIEFEIYKPDVRTVSVRNVRIVKTEDAPQETKEDSAHSHNSAMPSFLKQALEG